MTKYLASNPYTPVDLDRRSFMAVAAALGATLAWGGRAHASRQRWRERRDLYPEGVASGDPESTSVLLWTRRPFGDARQHRLIVEVARDEQFRQVVSQSPATVEPSADWTCRVLAAGLKPDTIYWYRFTDEEGGGSRIGRTRTAPAAEDERTVRFAFASCQSVNEGKLNAYRRMLWEDARAPANQRLDFVLHLGDFIYEVVQYPEEVQRRYDRTIYDIGRVPNARKVRDFHVPTDLAGYRMVYQAHLRDPDLQDTRASFPFVCMGDNHEFSWLGWQSFTKFDGKVEPAQELRVAAKQAWWEYIPSRARKSSGDGLARFDGPVVANAPIAAFDDDGFGQEPNNLAAVGSLTTYRAFRFGRHVELILTDQHSHRMEEQTGRPEAKVFSVEGFPDFYPEQAMAVIDGGRAYAGGNPPDEIVAGVLRAPNFRKDAPPCTLFGKTQREWLKRRLTSSSATWKIWGSTGGTLDWRADPQNLPPEWSVRWPGDDYAGFGGGDFSGAYVERAEIYDAIRDAGVTGFVTVAGDRHSFWAGYAAKSLPPAPFEPIGVAFITGSLSAPGLVEAVEHVLPKTPVRQLYLADRPGQAKPDPVINLTMHRGVRSALEYGRSGDIEKARALTNPELSPHLEFIDMAGHGYSIVRASAQAVEVEFVCIPRPIARAETADGGPLRYRVVHRADLWKRGERPQLKRAVIEGDVSLNI